MSKSKNAFLLTFYALSMNFRKWVCENIFKNRLQHPVAQFSTSKQHSSNVRLNLIIQNAKFENTLPRKNMNLTYSKRMYWTNFWQPTVHGQQNIFEKTLIEVGSSHLYASFDTFCVQIHQFLEVQWVLEKCLKSVKSLFSKENYVDHEFFRKFKISLCLK